MDFVDIVNIKDEIIGKTSEKEATFSKDIITRAVTIFFYNEKGKLFLTKRSKNKHRYPLHWDFSVGGIVNSGEDYKTAAIRELREELGINSNKDELKFVTKKYVEVDKKEHIVLFKLITNKKPLLDKIEIDSGIFLTKDEIKQKLKNKEKFNPYLLEFFEFI